MFRNRTSKGFTLVELLVVISIIGMLMALLLPAVQAAREAGRSNTCRNNLRNFGLAIAQYEQARSSYPGYNNSIGVGNNSDRSWTFVILPYMDKRAVFDTLKNNNIPNAGSAGAPIPGLEVANCPSSPSESVGGIAMSYVVNTGQLDERTAPASPPDYQGNGVFHRGVRQTAGQILPTVTSSYINGADGLGTTLMLSENADAGTWTGLQNNPSSNVTDERWVGFTYHPDAAGLPGTPTAESMGININHGESKSTTPQTPDLGYARASSYHPGGVNVMFCDSHVRFISDTISYGVFQALMTPKGSAAQYARSVAGGTRGNLLGPSHPAANVLIDESSIY